jgi:hypothetical protein
MTFGPNMKRVAAWAGAFLLAQGMIYRWGYDVGYLSGHRQGYADVFVESHNQQRSEAARWTELAQSDSPPAQARASDASASVDRR